MAVRLFWLVLCAGFGLAAPVLTYSTYLRDGFTPNAITTDSSGNIYLAGNLVVDPVARQTTALVAKLNPQATKYLYVRVLGGSVYESGNAIAVDSAGNAYIAGQTASADFPVTAGGNLAALPTGTTDQRSFVTKLDPTGNIVYSAVVGGTTYSAAQSIALTPKGQAIVSGLSYSSSFPTTAGAYAIADSKNHPYLLELDPTGTKLVFSATGIGGSALALDTSGNIYIAGTTTLTDYPTTPGAYQSKITGVQICFAPCHGTFAGGNQYVTKVDPTGSQLLYSTGLSGTHTSLNTGLAVDQAGNAYVTGIAGTGYPYTVTPPAYPSLSLEASQIASLPFVSKLDPTGQNLLFSVPAGGAGVQVDSNQSVYAGGRAGTQSSLVGGYFVPAAIPVLANVPSACLPNGQSIVNSAYVSQLDGASGNLLGTQFVGGSNLSLSAVALAGSTLWVAGPTSGPDVPLSPNALIPDFVFPDPGVGLGAGAYLGAVDFAQPQPAAGTPQMACVLDAADFSPAGSVARYQIVTIIGSNVGPATGVAAEGDGTFSLAGVSVNLGPFPAPLLYVSSTQINFAIPLVTYSQPSSVLKVTVNGVSSLPRQFVLNYNGTPHVFMNMAEPNNSSTNPFGGFLPLALNADGSINSGANPAKQSSTVSVFVNGLAPDPQINTAPVLLYSIYGWQVKSVTQINPFVMRVDVQTPAILINAPLPGPGSGCTQAICYSTLMLFLPYGQISPTSGVSVYIK
jgi:uncharacterized protein (TIGR03437 family)